MEEGILASYQFEILVDHNQFFLEVCEREWGDDDLDLLCSEGSSSSGESQSLSVSDIETP